MTSEQKNRMIFFTSATISTGILATLMLMLGHGLGEFASELKFFITDGVEPASYLSLHFATAAMLGVQRPQLYRFKYGDFEVTTILDGVAQMDGPHPFFGVNQSAETVQNYARDHHLPTDWFENGFVPALVNTGQELVLFDTGFGAARRGSGAGNLRELLNTAGYSPQEIDVVVITHGHPDHILGLMEEGRPAYENARYVFGETEFEFWNKGENIPEGRQENRDLFVKVVTPLAEKATFIKGGDDVVSGIQAIEAFGHSAGHMVFHVQSGGQQLLFMADTANHNILSLRKPDWQMRVDDNREMAVITRKRILDMVSNDKIPVIGHHMPFPSVGFIEKANEGYHWEPVSYHFHR